MDIHLSLLAAQQNAINSFLRSYKSEVKINKYMFSLKKRERKK